MDESNRAVPFVALNGCLREDFLQRVLQRALRFLPQASSSSAPPLGAALRTVAIPGFRQLARAPIPLQARAAVSRFRESGPFVGWVLEVWMEASEALAARVGQFLDREGIPQHRVQAAAGQFDDRWSLDTVLELADRFRTEDATTDRDDVALLICCLTSRAPVEDSAPAAAESSASEAQPNPQPAPPDSAPPQAR